MTISLILVFLTANVLRTLTKLKQALTKFLFSDIGVIFCKNEGGKKRRCEELGENKLFWTRFSRCFLTPAKH